MQQIGRVSIVESAIDEMRTQIRKGTWAIGERLPSEQELTKLFGISRAPLREATRALVHAGLLVARQGDGTYVVATDETAVALNRRLAVSESLDVLEVRRGLDVSAARLASQRRTPEDLDAMAATLRARRDAAENGHQRAFAESDVAFHLAVAAASHNSLLLDLYASISASIQASVDSAQSVHDATCGPVDYHDALLQAITDQDPATATAVALSIIDEQVEALAHQNAVSANGANGKSRRSRASTSKVDKPKRTPRANGAG